MTLDASSGGATATRVIVVEDSFPVAAGLEALLQSAGCTVVGKAANIDAALALVSAVPFDVALLDIDLRGQNVTPVADAVTRQDRPIIFLSGYGDAEMLPPHLRSLPRLEKPADPDQLFAAIARVMARAR